MNKIRNYIKKEWKKSKEGGKIISKVIKEAEKTNPKKTLLAHIFFSLSVIFFLFSAGLLFDGNITVYQSIFLNSLLVFSLGFFTITYLAVIKQLSKTKKEMK